MTRVFVLYSHDDPDNAPVMDVEECDTAEQAWRAMFFESGALYSYEQVNHGGLSELVNRRFEGFR